MEGDEDVGLHSALGLWIVVCDCKPQTDKFLLQHRKRRRLLHQEECIFRCKHTLAHLAELSWYFSLLVVASPWHTAFIF